MESYGWPDGKKKKNKKNVKSSRRRRFRLWLQNQRCIHCGKVISFDKSTLDHIKPRAEGGTNEEDNLGIACYKCNHDKGCLSVKEWKYWVAFEEDILKDEPEL